MTRGTTENESQQRHAEEKTVESCNSQVKPLRVGINEVPSLVPGWDAWRGLSAHTSARIGLGRAGAATRTEVHLAFQAAHAAARDAVHIPWDIEATRRELEPVATHVVASCAGDRQTYLLRPDLGRQLAAESRAGLLDLRRESGQWDVAIVLTNGLSTDAVQRHGAALTHALLAAFATTRRAVAPVVLVANGRVALGDPTGTLLGARAVVIVVGERPGLSASDSLGIYLTLLPEDGSTRTDADRNCISNVHPPGGLDYPHAAAKCAWLLNEALTRGYSGVQLKDESPNGLVLVRSPEEA